MKYCPLCGNELMSEYQNDPRVRSVKYPIYDRETGEQKNLGICLICNKAFAESPGVVPIDLMDTSAGSDLLGILQDWLVGHTQPPSIRVYNVDSTSPKYDL